MLKIKTGFCDGTFEIVPKIFKQLYTLNGFIKSSNSEYKSVPIMMFLTETKSKYTYKKVNTHFYFTINN